MADSVQFDNPSVRARVTAMRAEAASAGISGAEFDEALTRADASDGNRDLFSDTDLGVLEQGVHDIRQTIALQPPRGFVPPPPRASVAEKIDENAETNRRAAAASAGERTALAPDIIRNAVAAKPVNTTPPAATDHRDLASNGVTRTTYWGRVSPDGQFFAIGSNMGVSAFDIRPGQSNAVHFRQGSFDPTFATDALIFQGSGTWRAPLDWLRNNPPTEVTGEVPGFVTRIGSLALYQDVGGNRESGVAIDGYTWAGDSGPSRQDPRVTGSPSGIIRIHGQAGLSGTEAASNVQTISTPFHAGFQMSNDGSHVVAQITDPDHPNQQVGYAIYRLDRGTNGAIDLTPVRAVSGLRGGKPKMGGDYVAFHHAITRDDFAAYGFASADDPAFADLLRRGTADIYLYNMRDNTVRRATNAGPGNLAWYPSFSQDAQGNYRIHYLQQNTDGSRHIMSVPVNP